MARMTHATFTIAVAFLSSAAAATSPPVTFESPLRMSRQPRGTSLGGEERSFNSACGCERNTSRVERSEEHTSELQSRLHLVCRLLLEKKNILTARSTPYLKAPFVTTWE